MDLVRPDALSVGLLAASLAFGLERGRAMTVAAGLLLFAAFTVKHNIALFGLPMVLGIWIRDGRRGLLTFVAFAVLPALLVSLLLLLLLLLWLRLLLLLLVVLLLLLLRLVHPSLLSQQLLLVFPPPADVQGV